MPIHADRVKKQAPLGDHKINLGEKHHRKLKVLAAQEGFTMKALLEQLIDAYVSSSREENNGTSN